MTPMITIEPYRHRPRLRLSQQRPAARYAFGAAAAAVAALARFAMQMALPGHGHYLFFAVAVLVTAVFGGTLPALLCALLGVFFANLPWWDSGPGGGIELAEYLFATIVILWVSARLVSFQRNSLASERLAAERAQAAAVLAEELELLIDGAEAYAIYMVDPQGYVTVWNHGAERLTGWSEAEALGRPMSIFYSDPAVAAGEAERDLAQARAEGRLVREEWRRRKNGSEFLAHVTMTALHDGEGRLRGFGKVVRDITAERASERTLAASAEQFRTILATVPDAMVLIDATGTIRSFSRAAEVMFGYAASEIIGSNVSRLMPEPDHSRHDSYIRRYLETGEKRIIGHGRTVIAARRDGSHFPIELSVAEANGPDGRIFTGFIRDLSERFDSEERIEHLQQELVHASRLSAMGTMAATLAHEINQPITSIATFVRGARKLIRGGERDRIAEITEALDLANEEAMRAGEIVHRLRDFVARGDLEKSAEPLPELIAEASRLVLIGARETRIETEFECDPALAPVFVDRIQIQQVLVNLMRNAIEAMADSPVRRLRVSAHTGENGFAHVIVADTGPGLAPGVAGDLFRAFHGTKRNGLGLGLSICRTIVEANGGKIWAAPRAGGGTEFHFTLPPQDGKGSDG